MSASRKNKRVAIYSPTYTDTGGGTKSTAYTLSKTVWASVKISSSKTDYERFGIEEKDIYKITMFKRSISKEDKLKYAGMTLQILSINDTHFNNKDMIITATAIDEVD